MENYERGEKLGEGAWGVVTSAVSYDLNRAKGEIPGPRDCETNQNSNSCDSIRENGLNRLHFALDASFADMRSCRKVKVS